ncbi:hypothetical protein ACGFYY_20975 [Streptomyces sp. NPDC048331]|uniref:hypothetical protein n=1 Tax=Streptomyces sp. NPDC048331 TaxID=3365534 RepID=UPI00371D3934
MTTTNSVTRVKDDYARQIAADLAANRAAQEERRTELDRLQQELSELEQGEKVLLRMQDALGVAAQPTTAQPGGRGTKPAAVPSARTASKATKKTPQSPPVVASAPAPAAAAVKAPRPRKAPATTGTGTGTGTGTASRKVKEAAAGPSWLELITAVLAGRTEPRSAAEVAEAVGAAHPTRKVQATVIRNTLEQGVARGLLERSKQGRSVYYSPTVPTPAEHTTEQPEPSTQPKPQP